MDPNEALQEFVEEMETKGKLTPEQSAAMLRSLYEQDEHHAALLVCTTPPKDADTMPAPEEAMAVWEKAMTKILSCMKRAVGLEDKEEAEEKEPKAPGEPDPKKMQVFQNGEKKDWNKQEKAAEALNDPNRALTNEDWREEYTIRLQEIYAKHNPEKAGVVPGLLRAAKAKKGQFRQMKYHRIYEKICKKYKVEPDHHRVIFNRLEEEFKKGKVPLAAQPWQDQMMNQVKTRMKNEMKTEKPAEGWDPELMGEMPDMLKGFMANMDPKDIPKGAADMLNRKDMPDMLKGFMANMDPKDIPKGAADMLKPDAMREFMANRDKKDIPKEAADMLKSLNL